VEAAVDAYRTLSHEATPSIILVASYGEGVFAAMRQREQLAAVEPGASVSPLMILAPDNTTCTPAFAPCAFSAGRFATYMQGGRKLVTRRPLSVQQWERALRVRVHYFYRFFAAGANVIQLDSDISLLRSPLPLLHSERAGFAVVGQAEYPLINCGFVSARHMHPASDTAVRWMLREWNNRLLLLSEEGTKPGTLHSEQNVAEQAIVNDVLVSMAADLPRYTLFHAVELRGRVYHHPEDLPKLQAAHDEEEKLHAADYERILSIIRSRQQGLPPNSSYSIRPFWVRPPAPYSREELV
jgi:hypothetical protein